MDTPTFSNRATGRRQESQPGQVFCFKLDELRSLEDIVEDLSWIAEDTFL